MLSHESFLLLLGLWRSFKNITNYLGDCALGNDWHAHQPIIRSVGTDVLATAQEDGDHPHCTPPALRWVVPRSANGNCTIVVGMSKSGSFCHHEGVVAPGADPKAVRLDFESTDELTLDEDGNVILRVDFRNILIHEYVRVDDRPYCI